MTTVSVIASHQCTNFDAKKRSEVVHVVIPADSFLEIITTGSVLL